MIPRLGLYIVEQMMEADVVIWLEVRGPNDEECLDGQLIRKNTDEETIQMAVNIDD